MSSLIYPLLILIFTISSHSLHEEHLNKHQFHPDTGLNISQLLDRHGYPFEQYTVQTEDGYLLGLHRIPYGVQNKRRNINKPIALLVHGLMCQSTDWVNNEPDNSLGLILADQGYDVWLLNTRGNTHSRKHITLDPDEDEQKFWDFSWHESGIYDLPATIDFILNNTNQQKLFYIGHSRGTTVFFVMASVVPEYNKKIRSMTALAPLVFMNRTGPIKTILSRSLPLFHVIVELFNIHELLPHRSIYLKLAKTCCYEGSLCYDLCSAIVNVTVGYSPTEFNMTMLPVHLSNSPSGFSAKDGFHYFQQFDNGGRFRLYDYGLFGNLRRYKQIEPPEYDLGEIDTPVALHYALDDQTFSQTDIDHLISVLPNVAQARLVPLKHFNHLNFIWANHARSLIYDAVLEELKKY